MRKHESSFYQPLLHCFFLLPHCWKWKWNHHNTTHADTHTLIFPLTQMFGSSTKRKWKTIPNRDPPSMKIFSSIQNNVTTIKNEMWERKNCIEINYSHTHTSNNAPPQAYTHTGIEYTNGHIVIVTALISNIKKTTSAATVGYSQLWKLL